jgi:acetate CoA/acetoacetate CoA-transferase alpha subunit
MLHKEVLSPSQAVSHIKSGMTVMVGGFMAVGTPEKIIDALVETDITDLTIICNDAGLPDKGVGKLIAAGKVKKLIASHIGLNRVAGNKMSSNEMEVTLIPQGTLIEQIRAGGSGLGGVLTQTGLNTIVEEGKQKVEVDGKEFLIEKPLTADISLIKTSVSDVFGNSFYNKTTNNFNAQMAIAGSKVIASPDQIAEPEEHPGDRFTTPSIFIDYLVE